MINNNKERVKRHNKQTLANRTLTGFMVAMYFSFMMASFSLLLR